MLRRLLRYSDKVFDLRDLIKTIGDGRERPRIGMEEIFVGTGDGVMSIGEFKCAGADQETKLLAQMAWG